MSYDYYVCTFTYHTTSYLSHLSFSVVVLVDDLENFYGEAEELDLPFIR